MAELGCPFYSIKIIISILYAYGIFVAGEYVDIRLFALRFPLLPALGIARKKKPVLMNAGDVEVDVGNLRLTDLMELTARVSNTVCEFIEGKTMEEAGYNLALKLIEAKVI